MPLNPAPLAAGFLAPNLVATGNLGVAVPTLALGIASGVCQYLTSAVVNSVDVGTAGVGTTLFPLIVPSPLIQSSILSGFAAMGIMGIAAPALILGLSTGISTGLSALALLQINHPGVGVGAGVVRLTAATAVPFMINGMASVSMSGAGPTKVATALGIGLDLTFASFVQLAVPIVGSPSPVASSGVGLGTVI